ncbi:hypothetical protein AGMMS50276_10680 [Synergistales bacterium]|nr:hypothetical protein AGMMS50276_10680 [Synergistales bacterium]
MTLNGTNYKAEKQYFSMLQSACEIGYTQNANGTIAAYLRIPFLDNADPALIEAIRAIISGLTASNLSYAYVDTNGRIIPITAKTTRTTAVKAPYLQIAFTVSNLDAPKKGSLEGIEY